MFERVVLQFLGWLAFLFAFSIAANAAEFFRLSDYLPGIQYSRVTDVSADGTTVVGEYSFQAISDSGRRSQAFVWKLGGAITSLTPIDPAFPNAATDAYAYRVSNDGSRVMGQVNAPNSRGATFLWSQSEGFTYLDLPQSFSDMNGDGTMIVGSGSGPFYAWEEGRGVTSYSPPAAAVAWDVRAISDNGRFVVGAIDDSITGFPQAYRFDFVNDPVLLPTLGALEGIAGMAGMGAAGEMESVAFVVSNKGVVGAYSTTPDGRGSYRWTEQGGAELLGEIGPVPYSSNPLDISPNGKIIVGDTNRTIDNGFNGDAFLWVEGIGNRSIEDILAASDYEMSEWNLGANGVSDNGRVIVGSATNPNRLHEGWVAVLDTSEVPEPASVVLLCLGGICWSVSQCRSIGKHRCLRRCIYRVEGEQ